MSRERGFPAVAACLRERKDAILAAWEREVRRLRGLAADEPSSSVLRDDVPEMISALAGAIAEPGDGPILDTAPYEHALQRYAEDVPLERIVEEYRVLRRELFAAVARDAPEELPDAWPRISEHIDRAIEEAVSRYSEQRARWLREREQEIEAVVGDLPVGVVVIEASSRRIARTNREMASIQAGVARARTLDDLAALGVERDDGTSCAPDELPLARALRGEDVGPEELRVTAPSGAWVVVEVRARPLVDSKGGIRGAVSISADVTERVRVRAERQLLAATLGHDVRSPIATIRIAGQRLQQVEGSETARKLSGGIVRSAARLTDLVTELLELAQSWERAVELSRERLDLAQLCRDVAAEPVDAAEGLEVRVSAPQSVVGQWDRQRLVRVVTNLLDNARKYGDPSGGIDVAVRRLGDAAELSVTNRGEPLSGGEESHLFEPYGRGERGAAGSGLGLFIVKEFTEAHGGRVEVSSGESHTTFRVLLPIHPRGSEFDTPSGRS